ncbi:MAG: bifunctional diaminohydroxyphosphoribosylaminopyrimidine deaminase/5-amino-6-(5-phosphoribosylamino)uracil reductase RibD [Saprospiraceae bacterium]|nr:bifunctional diaminohydroxyphosphoribosylaminopyrimidine deaminase/5-amino-6-(5-phosphoribosylamino)uracil reductase RibD [Saprospiraceae bacterium]
MQDESYIKRCFDLAKLGRGSTSPNPTVGAVIVYQDRIIGEGYHQRYGGAHAEVNAVKSVKPKDLPLLKEATLYCSLEPCSIFGKTPPCTDLIIRHQIPKVVLSYIDHTPGVDGLGVAKLRAAGVEVILNVLEKEGQRLSAARNTFVKLGRPYVILKLAMSQDGYIARDNQAQLWLTNSFSKRLVHKWRSEIDAILVGTNTAAWDNPQLNNRLFYGASPTRLVVDRHLRLPHSLALFDGSLPTYVYTQEKVKTPSLDSVNFVGLSQEKSVPQQILDHLAEIKKIVLMVEGGATLLQEFLKQDLWDEIRLFQTPAIVSSGIKAPPIPVGHDKQVYHLLQDQLTIIHRDRVLSATAK